MAFGFHIGLAQLLHSYLSDKYQKVRYKSFESRPTILVRSRVPQGSNLGPLLFLLLINDLLEVVQHSPCLFYTDDLNIYKEINCSINNELLQTDLINRVYE